MKTHSLRFCFILLAVMVLLMTISPKLIGLSIQSSTIDNIIELIPAESKSQFTITQQSLVSGWFRSESSLKLSYSPPGSDANSGNIAVQLDLNIDHGPLLMTAAGPRLGLAYANITPRINSDAFDLAIAEFPFALPDITLDLLAGFDQSVEIDLEISPLDYSDNEGELHFGGIDGNYKSAADQSAEFNLHMGRLQASENSARLNFNISGLEINSHSEQITNILAPSRTQLTIPLIESSSPYPLTASDISSSTRLTVSPRNNSNVDFFQHFAIEEISSDFPLSSLSWDSELRDLDGSAIKNYYQLLSDLQNETSLKPDTTLAEANQLIQQLILISIQNSLVFNNLIKLNAYQGEHQLQLDINWSGLPQLGNIAQLNINHALAALQVNVDLSLNLEAMMASPAAPLLDLYVQQGYLDVDNDQILLKASLTDSVLTINGEETPLDQIF